MRSFLVRNWCGGTNDLEGDVYVPALDRRREDPAHFNV